MSCGASYVGMMDLNGSSFPKMCLFGASFQFPFEFCCSAVAFSFFIAHLILLGRNTLLSQTAHFFFYRSVFGLINV